MDFLEDILDRKHRHRDLHDHDSPSPGGYYRSGDDYHDRDRGRYGMESFRPILLKILRNRPLVIGLAIGACLLLATGVALIFALLPLFTHSIEYVNQHGVKGIVDALMPVLERIWKGKE
jgi:hypothetical protein